MAARQSAWIWNGSRSGKYTKNEMAAPMARAAGQYDSGAYGYPIHPANVPDMLVYGVKPGGSNHSRTYESWLYCSLIGPCYGGINLRNAIQIYCSYLDRATGLVGNLMDYCSGIACATGAWKFLLEIGWSKM